MLLQVWCSCVRYCCSCGLTELVLSVLVLVVLVLVSVVVVGVVTYANFGVELYTYVSVLGW